MKLEVKPQADQLTGTGPLVRIARAIVWAFFGAAILVGAFGLVFGAIQTITGLADGHIALTLIADHALPRDADAGPAVLVSGRYNTAGVVVANLPGGVVALATLASITSILTVAAVAVCIAVPAWRLLRGQLFRRTMTLIVTFAGGVLLVGGFISQGSGRLAAWMAAGELNGPGRDGIWPIAGIIDFTSIAFGVVLMLVGLAFEYGERLQRDTDGLV